MATKKFLRRSVDRYSKIGKGRKKKQKWRRPTGRDNKMREKRRGYPAVVSIGHKKENKSRELIKGKNSVRINNLLEIDKIKKNEIIIIGHIGKKKKMEIVKKANEMKIEIFGINPKKFLKINQKLKKDESKK